MNRRGFFGLVGSVIAAPVLAKVTDAPPPFIEYAQNTPPPVFVQRANGQHFIVGVATETVQAGDFVQIQTAGHVTANLGFYSSAFDRAKAHY